MQRPLHISRDPVVAPAGLVAEHTTRTRPISNSAAARRRPDPGAAGCVIDANGTALGVMPTAQALQQAREKGSSSWRSPPTPSHRSCASWTTGRACSSEQPRSREHAKRVEIKGVRIGMRISEHDFAHKVDQTRRFLGEGHKIKLELVMRGREQAFQLRSRAYEQLDKFIAALEVPIVRESDPTKVGNRLTVMLGAGKAKKPSTHAQA
ncbi:MAG: hypothetical protein U0514_02090 [Candidatus Andersenbacteria bacterium]